ncbi:hypothetical protein [Agaribacterium haliotis]|uniref:hypothetical protein n=1 Tax=Agaribacterium haliotis TaxID=2013869 RepID=UPI000BB56B18|nr:hypothetical protein [Agaribacterium haliotis]
MVDKTTASGKKAPQKKKKNKEAQLVIRLEKELRDNFIAACQDIDTTAARELRGFIKKFLKRYDKGEFDDT